MHDNALSSEVLNDAGVATPTRGSALHAVTAAAVGNVLEWYDFAVYAFVAPILARNYFPKGDDLTALLGTFAIFGVGFLMRPLGGLWFGRLANSRGRKRALTMTISLMAFSTIAIGVIPSYQTIGVAASVLMMIARLMQGFSAGGEWGTANAFLVESAPEGRRGVYASFAQVTTVGGTLLGSVVAAIFSSSLSNASFESWGWRLPFFIGGLIGPIGFYIRRNVVENAAVRKILAEAPQRREPQLKKIMQAIGFTVVWVVSHYILLHYMPTFLIKYSHLSRSQALWSDSIGLLVLIACIPLTGAWSDRVGRKPLLIGCCVLLILLSYPLVHLMLSGASFAVMIAIQILFGIVLSTYSGPAPAALAEMFSTRNRSIGMSVGYSIGVALFGGFAPFFATLLIHLTNSPIAPVYLVIAAAVISILTLVALPETGLKRLD